MTKQMKLLMCAVLLIPALTQCMEFDSVNIAPIVAQEENKQEYTSGLSKGVRIGAAIGLGAFLVFTCKNALEIGSMNPQDREDAMSFLRFITLQNKNLPAFLLFHGAATMLATAYGAIGGAVIGGTTDIVGYALHKIKAYRAASENDSLEDCPVIESGQ